MTNEKMDTIILLVIFISCVIGGMFYTGDDGLLFILGAIVSIVVLLDYKGLL